MSHVLVIHSQGIDYSIQHEHECPTEVYAEGPPGDGPIIDYTCNVGRIVADMGLEVLDLPDEYDPKEGWQALPEGRYEIEFWSERHPGTLYGVTEWSAGLSLGTKLA